jgi:hypothetical protein
MSRGFQRAGTEKADLRRGSKWRPLGVDLRGGLASVEEYDVCGGLTVLLPECTGCADDHGVVGQRSWDERIVAPCRSAGCARSMTDTRETASGALCGRHGTDVGERWCFTWRPKR